MNNSYIEEDWERVILLDSMYVLEHKMSIEEEWQQWEEYKNTLPARIEIIKIHNNENRRTRERTL